MSDLQSKVHQSERQGEREVIARELAQRMGQISESGKESIEAGRATESDRKESSKYRTAERWVVP